MESRRIAVIGAALVLVTVLVVVRTSSDVGPLSDLRPESKSKAALGSTGDLVLPSANTRDERSNVEDWSGNGPSKKPAANAVRDKEPAFTVLPIRSKTLAFMADHYSTTAEEIEQELLQAHSTFFDWELAPLEPWADAEAQLVDRLMANIFGGTEKESQLSFEKSTLGSTIAKRIAEAGPDQGAVAALGDDLVAISESCRSDYEIYKIEMRSAIQSKVSRGLYDRWPYLTLTKRRAHTQLPGKRATFVVATAMKGGWAVQVDLYEEEFPTLNEAQRIWRECQAIGKAKAKELP